MAKNEDFAKKCGFKEKKLHLYLAQNVRKKCAKNNFGNEQQVSATIDLPAPDSQLSMEARHCIESHYEPDSDLEIEYPYLSKIIYVNDTKLNSLKKDHIKIMDDYFEDKDYVNSKKHADLE